MEPVVAITFIVVGLPVVGGLAFAAYSEYLKHRREIAALQKAERKEVERLRERISELERRVEVLEAVVTSPEFQLFRERMRQIQAEAIKATPSAQHVTFSPPQTFRGEEQKEKRV